MRAVRHTAAGPASVSTIVDAPEPSVAPDEVLVAVAAVGLNPVDVKIRAAGHDFGPIEHSDAPGWDVAGTIAQVGDDVTGLSAGDEVYALARFPHAAHTLAERVAVPASDVALAPASWSVEQRGAAPLAGLTALHALDAAGLPVDATGRRVLVLGGAGGVGHLAVQLAAARGAHVVATASPGKHALLRELGAAEVVDHHDAGALDAIDPVDVVLSTVTSGAPPRHAVRQGTSVVTITDIPEADEAWMREAGADVVGRIMVAADAAGLATIAALADAGDVTVHVEQTYPLDEIVAAQEHLETGHVTGKIVVTLP